MYTYRKCVYFWHNTLRFIQFKLKVVKNLCRSIIYLKTCLLTPHKWLLALQRFALFQDDTAQNVGIYIMCEIFNGIYVSVNKSLPIPIVLRLGAITLWHIVPIVVVVVSYMMTDVRQCSSRRYTRRPRNAIAYYICLRKLFKDVRVWRCIRFNIHFRHCLSTVCWRACVCVRATKMARCTNNLTGEITYITLALEHYTKYG